MGQSHKKNFSFADLLWDTWCVISVVGIWPRFIEPKLLKTTRLDVKLPGLKKDLKAVAFSDLHLNPCMSETLLEKIVQQTKAFNPDLIFFLGDFLCDGHLDSKEQLESFLKSFSAPLGVYAVLGNHDYSDSVSINEKGDYDVTSGVFHFKKAFSRLFSKVKLSSQTTERAQQIKDHYELLETLSKTPFKLLNNKTVLIDQDGVKLNITGLGEYMMGKALPEQAYQNYDPSIPGITLVHNPDMIPRLKDYPGSLVLSGHTHGGQINLPWVSNKLTMMEDFRYKIGRVEDPGKTAFISRGVGSVKPFRWNAPPELVLITLKGDS